MSNELVPFEQRFPLAMAAFSQVGKPKTFQDIIRCSSAKLRAFEAMYGTDVLEEILVAILTDLSTSMTFNIEGKFVMSAARLIIEDYPDTKISDFKFFAREVLSGRIGKKIYRWDVRTIMELWKEYYELREEEYEAARISNMGKENIGDAYAKPITDLERKLNYEKMTAYYEREKRLSQEFRDHKKTQRERMKNSLINEEKSMLELCDMVGVRIEDVADGIREQAQDEFNAKMGIPFETFLAIRTNSAMVEARKNPNYLLSFINQ